MAQQKIQAEELRAGDEVLAAMTAEYSTVQPITQPFNVTEVKAGGCMVTAWDADQPKRRLDIQGFTPVYIRPRSA